MKWTEKLKHDFLTDIGKGSRADTDKGCQVPSIESDSGAVLTRLAQLHCNFRAFRYRDGCIDIVLRGVREQSKDSGDTFHVLLSLALRSLARRGMKADVNWAKVKEDISEAFPLWTSFARVGELPIISVDFT